MELMFTEFSLGIWVFAICVALFAGVVKGLVGFAMPMIMISGLSTVLDPLVAIAAMVLPTLVTNLVQAFAQGVQNGIRAMQSIWRYLLVAGVVLVITSQLPGLFSQRALLLTLGVLISFFSAVQILGLELRMSAQRARVLEPVFAVLSGFFGGLAGIWGPPLVAYLTSVNTPKDQQIRAQGIAFGLGAILLAAAHLNSGVLNGTTIPFSLVLIIPAMLGMVYSAGFQPRINEAQFKRMTLYVLLIAGLNLLRRGFFMV